MPRWIHLVWWTIKIIPVGLYKAFADDKQEFDEWLDKISSERP